MHSSKNDWCSFDYLTRWNKRENNGFIHPFFTGTKRWGKGVRKLELPFLPYHSQKRWWPQWNYIIWKAVLRWTQIKLAYDHARMNACCAWMRNQWRVNKEGREVLETSGSSRRSTIIMSMRRWRCLLSIREHKKANNLTSCKAFFF